MKIILLICIGIACGFIGGYAASIRSHGDWILVRSQYGQCEAFDPHSKIIVGTWNTDTHDRCHMSRFIWEQIIDRPLRGLL